MENDDAPDAQWDLNDKESTDFYIFLRKKMTVGSGTCDKVDFFVQNYKYFKITKI